MLATQIKDEREWIPAMEACERIGCSRSTLNKRLREKRLVGKYNVSGRLHISRDSINKLLADLPRFGER